MEELEDEKNDHSYKVLNHKQRNTGQLSDNDLPIETVVVIRHTKLPGTASLVYRY
jgi:hypothetical protein